MQYSLPGVVFICIIQEFFVLKIVLFYMISDQHVWIFSIYWCFI